jgi:hypothetical protein
MWFTAIIMRQEFYRPCPKVHNVFVDDGMGGNSSTNAGEETRKKPLFS